MFTFPEDFSYGSNFGCYVALHSMLSTPEDRTKAVGEVIKCLGEEIIPGIRNEVHMLKTTWFLIILLQPYIKLVNLQNMFLHLFSSIIHVYYAIYSYILLLPLLGHQNFSLWSVQQHRTLE